MLQSPLRLTLAACVAFVLSACGQQGPLYLPNDPPPAQGNSICPTCARAPSASDAPSDKESADDENPDNTESDREKAEEATSETLESNPEPISDENSE